ncbi:hypothetical protein B0H19DRAFT_1277364 [Mycena capillaripes]|nr:hypothetical protein B0H19DRAFT_1277364 [Mycena capillaripes]
MAAKFRQNPSPTAGQITDLNTPFLKYLPEWFPGFKSGAIARECRPALQRLYDLPLQAVSAQMESETAKPLFLLSHLEDMKGTEPRNYDEVKWAAAAMFGSTEIDSVVGAAARLPGFEDRGQLSLVECIMQETLRFVLRVFGACKLLLRSWFSDATPPTEPDVPDALMKDDVYEGMFIPKGSTVFANIR